MPTTPTPYLHPTQLCFYLSESPQTETFGLYNPYPQDILFKVDNAHPEKYKVSLTQGVVSGRNKIFIEVTCTSRVPARDEAVQVRFFKWSRPRHGQKPQAQQYVGFREVKINVLQDRSEKERTPSDKESVSFSAASIPGGLPGKPGSGSTTTGYPLSDAGSNFSSEASHSNRRCQVITNLITAFILLLCGFALNQLDETWFSINIMNGVKPQTLAIVAYTLAGVIIIKLLTFR